MKVLSHWPRRGAAALAGLTMVVASLIGTTDRAAAAGGTSPQTAALISSLPFTDTVHNETIPYSVATGSANTKVANECNTGKPLYAPRWFTYTPTTTRTIVAQSSLGFYFSRDWQVLTDVVAVLSADLKILDCSLESPGRVTTAGPLRLPAGTKVYLAHFATSQHCDAETCPSSARRSEPWGPRRTEVSRR